MLYIIFHIEYSDGLIIVNKTTNLNNHLEEFQEYRKRKLMEIVDIPTPYILHTTSNSMIADTKLEEMRVKYQNEQNRTLQDSMYAELDKTISPHTKNSTARIINRLLVSDLDTTKKTLAILLGCSSTHIKNLCSGHKIGYKHYKRLQKYYPDIVIDDVRMTQDEREWEIEQREGEDERLNTK